MSPETKQNPPTLSHFRFVCLFLPPSCSLSRFPFPFSIHFRSIQLHRRRFRSHLSILPSLVFLFSLSFLLFFLLLPLLYLSSLLPFAEVSGRLFFHFNLHSTGLSLFSTNRISVTEYSLHSHPFHHIESSVANTTVVRCEHYCRCLVRILRPLS